MQSNATQFTETIKSQTPQLFYINPLNVSHELEIQYHGFLHLFLFHVILDQLITVYSQIDLEVPPDKNLALS